jgi:hypothetical protein
VNNDIDIVFMIDNSASMTSTDSTPKSGGGSGSDKTRLDEAKRRAKEKIEQLYGGGLFASSSGETMIIVFSDRAEVYQRFTASKAALLDAIDRIQPTHGETKIAEALKLAVQRPALCGPSFDALGAGCFTAPVHASVFDLIAGCGGTSAANGGREWAERLRTAAPDDRARGFVTQLAVEPLRAPRADGEPDARYADAVLARVEELAVSRQIAAIKSRLQRMSPVAEPAEYNRMFGDLMALEGRHRALWERVPPSL